MNRINYAEALRRRWWLVAILGVVGLAIGLVIPVSPAKPHSARWETTTLVGSVPPSGPGSSSILGSGVGVTQILFYAKSSSVITAAAHQAGIHKPLPALESDINVSVPTSAGRETQPGVVRLRTVAATPAQAANFSNDFANQLGAYLEGLAKQTQQNDVKRAQERVTALEAELAASGGTKRAPTVATQLRAAQLQVGNLEAVTPSTGYSILQLAEPSTARNVSHNSALKASHLTFGVLGLLLGVLVGVLLVVLLEAFDKRLRTSARAAEAFGYPVAAEIPALNIAQRSALGVGRSSDPHAEVYRKLRMSVLLETLAGQTRGRPDFADSAPRRQVVLVISPSDEPTRSSVVDNLAAATAEAGQRAIVVDALNPDPEGDSSRAAQLDLEPSIDEVEDMMQPSRLKNVALLTLSQLIGNSSQLLTRAPAILDVTRLIADMVIVEAPPLLAFHDGEALAAVADVVLVVGEWGRTTVSQARQTGELLRRFDAPTLGVVFTAVPMRSADLRQAERSRAPAGRRSELEPDRPTPATAP
jgi:Mrp family chromosome partitioning ATPase/capsular polysaccharide biosynthesis protein